MEKKNDPPEVFPGGSFCITDRHEGEPFLQTKDIKMGDLEQFLGQKEKNGADLRTFRQ